MKPIYVQRDVSRAFERASLAMSPERYRQLQDDLESGFEIQIFSDAQLCWFGLKCLLWGAALGIAGAYLGFNFHLF